MGKDTTKIKPRKLNFAAETTKTAKKTHTDKAELKATAVAPQQVVQQSKTENSIETAPQAGSKQPTKTQLTDLPEDERRRREHQRQMRELALKLRAQGKPYQHHRWHKNPIERPQGGVKKKEKIKKKEKEKKVVRGKMDEAMLPKSSAQVVIIPIYWNTREAEKNLVIGAAERAKASLEQLGLSVIMDISNARTPGQKMRHWEMRGVPLRVELGPRDAGQGTCVLAVPTRPGAVAKKQQIKLTDLAAKAKAALPAAPQLALTNGAASHEDGKAAKKRKQPRGDEDEPELEDDGGEEGEEAAPVLKKAKHKHGKGRGDEETDADADAGHGAEEHAEEDAGGKKKKNKKQKKFLGMDGLGAGGGDEGDGAEAGGQEEHAGGQDQGKRRKKQHPVHEEPDAGGSKDEDGAAPAPVRGGKTKREAGKVAAPAAMQRPKQGKTGEVSRPSGDDLGDDFGLDVGGDKRALAGKKSRHSKSMQQSGDDLGDDFGGDYGDDDFGDGVTLDEDIPHRPAPVKGGAQSKAAGKARFASGDDLNDDFNVEFERDEDKALGVKKLKYDKKALREKKQMRMRELSARVGPGDAPEPVQAPPSQGLKKHKVVTF